MDYDTSTKFRYLPVHEDEAENVNCYICKNAYTLWEEGKKFAGPTLFGYVRGSAFDWMVPWIKLNMSMPLHLAVELFGTLIAGAPESAPEDDQVKYLLEDFNIWDKKEHTQVESVNPYKALRIASALNSEVAMFEAIMKRQVIL